MDDLGRLLRKLTPKERGQMKGILTKLAGGDFRGLDIKKLKGAEDIFRARKGDLRIIYRKGKERLFVLAAERRAKSTYKNL